MAKKQNTAIDPVIQPNELIDSTEVSEKTDGMVEKKNKIDALLEAENSLNSTAEQAPSNEDQSSIPQIKQLNGNFEACDEKGIRGWVIDENCPNQPVEVDVIVDGESVARTIADEFRKDLVDAGLGHRAFIVAIPDKFFDKIEHKVEIREVESGQLLNGSPKSFNLLPVLPVKKVSDNPDIRDNKVEPKDIPLDTERNVLITENKAIVEFLNKKYDFSKPTQEISELISCYLPQFHSVLKVGDERVSSILSVQPKHTKAYDSNPQPTSSQKDEKSSPIKNGYSDYSIANRNRLIEIILKSGLFNHIFYVQQTDMVFGINAAIEHFLLTGADQKLKPMPHFDPQDYRSLNPDIPVLSNAECFVHYVLVGRTEKRYFNRTILMQDVARLRATPLFDNDWYSFCAKDALGEWSAYEHYLISGWRKNLSPNHHLSFDNWLYLGCYLDAHQSEKPPLLHYITQEIGRLSCMKDISHNMIKPILQSDEFDFEFYKSRCNEKNVTNIYSAILHYVCNGRQLKLDPNENFSTEYYLLRYADLKTTTDNSFIHYLNYGRKEGRIAHCNPHNHIQSGHIEFDPNKPSILVVCHEASRTGAPILGLQLIEHLSYRANIICWLGSNKGELLNDFVEASVAVINNPDHHADAVWVVRELRRRFSLEAAILNSVATSDISVALYEEKIPIVSLVHEYSDYMSQNVSQMLFAANRIVFPAQGVKASADINGINCFGKSRGNTIVRHQGRCIPPTGDGKNYTLEDILLRIGISEDMEMPAVVLGCGWVQMRKGVEYFIEAARRCKELIDKPVRFIWVGGGYAPNTDVSYSVWLKSQLVNSHLEDDVVFFEETSDLAPFFKLANVFFMSSRLDPFPNVALDAVAAGVPIVAFEGATGFADFIHKYRTVGAAVPFLDASEAAKVICDYVTEKRPRPDVSEEIAEELLFSTYADFIWNECQIAIEQQKQIVEESQLIAQSKQLDSDFYISATPTWQSTLPAEYVYVATWARGIATAKSRVGFNDMVAQSLLSAEIGGNSTITPLARMLTTKAVPLTHKTIYIDPDESCEIRERRLSVALHIHAHYTEALPSLLKRFFTLGQSITLCVTTDTDDKAKAIMAMAKKVFTKINVVVMPNRGRDVGPFIMAMKEHLSQFEIVGHFHLKGTKQLEQAIVRQWQDFLYDTLIGKQGKIADALLHKLEHNPKLGLLFQEDPCLPNWSKNRGLANKLLIDLAVNRQTPDNLEYPTGNMFWARTAALAPLLKHDWQWKDFPAEPVPYDGSILHAIERLTPTICEEAGYEWATVHNPNALRYHS